MEDQVEEIKRKTDIVGVIGQYVSLKKMGRHHKGLCPFHAEKTASFTVNEEMGLYKCFGCGVGGDVIKFLMEIEGVEFLDALERLADKVGIKLQKRKYDGGDQKQKLLEVMDLTARYYHWQLTEGKAGREALRYLTERGINRKLIETFRVGFALPGWNNLTSYLIGKKGYPAELLQKAGLVNAKSGGGDFFDKFRGRIMFPLLDAGGRVVGFSGRVLPSASQTAPAGRPGYEEPKYLNSPETEIYHKGRMLFGFFQAKQAIREKKRAVLVEGQMDLISSYAAGVSESVAVGGTALTEDQIEMISRLAKTIFLSFDADEAGWLAIKRAVEIAEKRGVEVKVVQIEGGKDPDEVARQSPDRWRKMVEGAVDVYEFVMEKALQKYNKSEVQGIKKITEEVIPFLAKIENSVVKEIWMRKFAEKLGVGVGLVQSEVERTKSGQRSYGEKERSKGEEEVESRTDKLMRRVIGGLLVCPGVRGEVKSWFDKVEPGGAKGKALRRLLQESEESPVKVIEKMPVELKEVFQEAFMAETDSEKVTNKEVEEVTGQLVRELVREEKRALMKEMKIAKEKGLEDEEERLFGRINELNREESRVVSLGG